MKRKKMFQLFLLIASCVLGMVVTTQRIQADTLAESQLTYQGKGESGQNRFLLNSDDLLPVYKNVMPGDQVTQKLLIKNQSKTETKLFLQLVKVEEVANDFFSQLGLVFTEGKAELYRGPLSSITTQGSLPLGNFKVGEEKQFNLELSVPLELENAYNAYQAESEWTFMATDVDTTKPKPKPKPKPKIKPKLLPGTGEGKWSSLTGIGTLIVSVVLVVLVNKRKVKKTNK